MLSVALRFDRKFGWALTLFHLWAFQHIYNLINVTEKGCCFHSRIPNNKRKISISLIDFFSFQRFTLHITRYHSSPLTLETNKYICSKVEFTLFETFWFYALQKRFKVSIINKWFPLNNQFRIDFTIFLRGHYQKYFIVLTIPLDLPCIKLSNLIGHLSELDFHPKLISELDSRNYWTQKFGKISPQICRIYKCTFSPVDKSALTTLNDYQQTEPS